MAAALAIVAATTLVIGLDAPQLVLCEVHPLPASEMTALASLRSGGWTFSRAPGQKSS
jgi:hypothetical protein